MLAHDLFRKPVPCAKAYSPGAYPQERHKGRVTSPLPRFRNARIRGCALRSSARALTPAAERRGRHITWGGEPKRGDRTQREAKNENLARRRGARRGYRVACARADACSVSVRL